MFRKSFLGQVRLFLVTVLLLSGASAAAASGSVLPFGADTWREMADSPLRPMAVVFTTTDCTHCPKVIDQLSGAIRKAGAKTRLVVVVMDGAGQEEALRVDRHYRDADHLYAFDGDNALLRYRVNPDWRGLTPYVALIPAAGAVRFHTGAPPADALRDFLRH